MSVVDQTVSIELPGFARGEFEALGYRKTLYERGDGPPVLVMHEIPGLIPEVLDFGRRVAEAGFTAVLPQLFGTPGEAFSVPYAVRSMARACISKEFKAFAHREVSPLTEWLRELCRHLHERHGGAGVGALGMCLTGNFALALMVDPWLMAPVLSQPSLPVTVSAAGRAAVHVPEAALARAKKRVDEDGVRVLGLRFSHDPLCPPERFETLRRALGDGFEGIEIDSGPGNANGHTRASHSVLTRHLIDEDGQPTQEALHRVLAFFRERLHAPGDAD